MESQQIIKDEYPSLISGFMSIHLEFRGSRQQGLILTYTITSDEHSRSESTVFTQDIDSITSLYISMSPRLKLEAWSVINVSTFISIHVQALEILVPNTVLHRRTSPPYRFYHYFIILIVTSSMIQSVYHHRSPTKLPTNIFKSLPSFTSSFPSIPINIFSYTRYLISTSMLIQLGYYLVGQKLLLKIWSLAL